jgi:hypothetical protein
MRRREFMKTVAAATGGFVFGPYLPVSRGETPPPESQIDRDLREIPGLDELAGDWMPGSVIEHTPALSNFHGSLESSRNVLGVQNFTIPPFAQGGELGILSLNGRPVAAQEFRWYPYQVQRRSTLEYISILTTVRMPFEQGGFLFAVEIANHGSASYAASVAISLRAAIRQYPGKWQWDTPRPREQDQGDFQPGAMHIDGSDVLCTKDAQSQSAAGFLFLINPEQAASSSNAAWKLTIKPGETFSLQGVMAVGPGIESVARQAAEWKTDFQGEWDEAKAGWETRYRAAFDPRNKHFSGNLPALVTSDSAIRKLYYHSILSLLCLERTNLNPQYPRVFVTASPRWATTLVYFWDTSFFATLWALLDPVCMKQQLTLFLASNIHSCYAIDFQSMETVGPWYSANDYSIFQLVNTYVNITGEHQFLNETVGGNRRVIDYLEEICLHWKTLTKPPGLLADYGDASNLLETVPTYIHRVPSMNAANVWMMRSMARIRTARGEADQARELNQLADKLAKEVLSLYVDGQGFWACAMPDGKKVEVRHCIDFFTTIGAMENELGRRRIEEMISFVNRELWTPDWLYALSPRDGAAKDSLRPDHGSTGSYDAWPALTAEAFFRAGSKTEALEHLRSVVPATREGPFGQAHYVATEAYPVRKALDLQDYFESASGSFAEVIVRTLFGLAGLAETEMPRTAAVPGFEGSLRNLRYRGKSLTITAPAR